MMRTYFSPEERATIHRYCLRIRRQAFIEPASGSDLDVDVEPGSGGWVATPRAAHHKATAMIDRSLDE